VVELPERPVAPAGAAERVRHWLRWVGPGRLVAGSVSVLAVLAAGYWLVKPPTATTESRLPFATKATSPQGGSRTSSHTSAVVVSTTLVLAVPSTGGEVVVDVAGAVQRGGVYRLPSGSRVTDAVRAAGGLGTTANADAVNLAAVLVDGQRVYIPRVGEPAPVDVPVAVPTTPAGPVDLNTATVDQLDRLPGVGPSTAAAIIAHRQQYGPFTSVEDLAAVKGIGPAKVAALRGLVTV
jgi:competence protein ComEA